MMKLIRNNFVHEGIRLSYLEGLPETETVDKTVLLLHGFTASAHSNWVETGWVNELIANGYRVIAPDACGHGESEKIYDAAVYPSSEMIKASLALLDRLTIQQVDVMGYSMGARMAAFGAIYQPHRFKKIILGGMGFNLHRGVGNAQVIADALLAKDLKQVKNRHGRIFRRLAEKDNNDLHALAHCILSSRQKITKEDLQQIQSQTLVVVGDNDSISGDAAQLAEILPNALSITIDDCNHFNALMKPNFRSSCLDFLFKGK